MYAKQLVAQSTKDKDTKPTMTTFQRRALLRQAALRKPNDERIKTALQNLVTPRHIQHAAQNGIFIGYNRSEDLFAMDLALDLRDSGVNVWIDITDVPNEMDWRIAVKEAMLTNSLMIFIASPESMQSKDSLAEVRYFLDHGKMVVPVLYDYVNIASLNLLIPPVDFRHDYSVGINSLLHLLTPPRN